jgi:hypothetical protein
MITVLDFSPAFEGRSAHEGISRRRRSVMEETDGSARAARYAANPAKGTRGQCRLEHWEDLARKYLFRWHR